MNLTTTAFGTWSAGRYMHFGEMLDEQRFLALIRHAYDSGIRTFVTADVYGLGKADEMLGLALQDVARDSYCLVGTVGHDIYDGVRAGSKGYPRFTDPALRDSSGYREYLVRATRASLERCRAEHFDLLMLHNPDSTGYSSPAVWDAMQGLKDEGFAERIGVAPGPANGFTLDMIDCFERFGDRIDWAMIILNPQEPWPGRLVLPAAEKCGVQVLTRVVDYGGIFWDDLKPGHQLRDGDHRAYRPAGWVEQGNEKLEAMRPYAERHGLSMIQLACQWNLAHGPVASVVPTVVQEAHVAARSAEDKVTELAQLPEEVRLTEAEVEELYRIGDNEGCMALKGASARFEGEQPLPDQWSLRPELLAVADRWGLGREW